MAILATYSPKESGPEYGKMSFAPVSGHGTSGFGAAIGAGSILKLNVEKMANAIGIAGYASPPSTFRKWTDTVPCRMTKYGPPGFTAEVGVRAALLADKGYYGDTNIFEGDHGYWRFTGFERWNKDIVVAELGRTWKCREVNYKKYPCGH
jgi:2-methylcitrate dehydratase